MVGWAKFHINFLLNIQNSIRWGDAIHNVKFSDVRGWREGRGVTNETADEHDLNLNLPSVEAMRSNPERLKEFISKLTE